MKKECAIYRDLLTAYKAVKATYEADGVPNKAVWRMAKRGILNTQAVLGVAMAMRLQERAMLKAGINPSEPADYTNFDWDNLDNFLVSEQ